MTAAWDEGLGAVERIIATAEARRIEQMLRIAVHLAEDRDAADVEAELGRTERLLKIMRGQRTLLIGARARRPANDGTIPNALRLPDPMRGSPTPP